MSTLDESLELYGPDARLRVQDLAAAGRHTLMLSGELDLACAQELETTIRQLCATALTRLVLDLSNLTFMDSSGIRAILMASQLCVEHGCEFAIVPGPANVQRVFEISGLDDRLPFLEGP